MDQSATPMKSRSVEMEGTNRDCCQVVIPTAGNAVKGCLSPVKGCLKFSPQINMEHPQKRSMSKGNFIFQPLIFRGEVLVFIGVLDLPAANFFHWARQCMRIVMSKLELAGWPFSLYYHGNPSYPPKATPLRNKALLRETKK